MVARYKNDSRKVFTYSRKHKEQADSVHYSSVPPIAILQMNVVNDFLIDFFLVATTIYLKF